MKKMLFVCTGNTCRSAMAEALMSKILKEKQISGWTADSAGLNARSGDAAAREAVTAAGEYGAHLSGHRAKQVDEEILESSDLILAMTASHRSALYDLAPGCRGRVFLLTEYALGRQGDITDPFGRGQLAYRACALQLYDALSMLASRLV
jgi:protein-tyrosine-phosphatase